jgi:hypothetical protein
MEPDYGQGRIETGAGASRAQYNMCAVFVEPVSDDRGNGVHEGKEVVIELCND